MAVLYESTMRSADTFTPSAYNTAAKHLPILFLPPDRVAQLSKHELSFLFVRWQLVPNDDPVTF